MLKPTFDPHDYEQHHLPGAVGYVLFFVPLVVNSKSPFCRFAANQGLLAFIAYLLASLGFGLAGMILGWIPALGVLLKWIVGAIATLVKLGILALAAYYGWRAYNGDALAFPYIGGIQLIR